MAGSSFSQSPRFDDAHLAEKKTDQRRRRSRRRSVGSSRASWTRKLPVQKEHSAFNRGPSPPVVSPLCLLRQETFAKKQGATSVEGEPCTGRRKPRRQTPGAEKAATMLSTHHDHGAHRTPGNPSNSKAGRRPQGSLGRSERLVWHTAHRGAPRSKTRPPGFPLLPPGGMPMSGSTIPVHPESSRCEVSWGLQQYRKQASTSNRRALG